MTDKPNSKENMSVDFSGLIFGFSSAALSYMGFSSGQPVKKNLELSQQNIQIIELLREKTKGNLSPEEAALVQKILADLSSKFAEVSAAP